MDNYLAELAEARTATARGTRMTQWLASRAEPASDAPPPEAAAGEETAFIVPPYRGFLPQHITTGGGSGNGGGYVFNNGNGKVWAESPDQYGSSWGYATLWVGGVHATSGNSHWLHRPATHDL